MCEELEKSVGFKSTRMGKSAFGSLAPVKSSRFFDVNTKKRYTEASANVGLTSEDKKLGDESNFP